MAVRFQPSHVAEPKAEAAAGVHRLLMGLWELSAAADAAVNVAHLEVFENE